MQLVKEKITINELKQMAQKMHGNMVKAVVDVEKEIMMVDAAFHADQEAELLDHGSEQGNLWGINIFPEKYNTADFIVFGSMINLRPSWGNRSRRVDDQNIQKKIQHVVNKLVSL